MWRYVFAYGGFMWFAWRVVRRIARREAVVAVQVTNFPDALVVAATPARRRGARIVLDIRDPMPELFLTKFGGGLFGRLGERVLRFEERRAGNWCDAVLCANDAHRSVTLAHGVDDGKLHVVLNAADERLFPVAQPGEQLAPRLVYHGTVARRMGLDVVVSALSLVRTDALPLTLDVYGDGDAVSSLRDLVRKKGLGDAVQISGRRHSMAELTSLIRVNGVGIVPLIADPFTDLLLPTKLIEYVRLGVPALVAWNTTIGRYFSDDMVYFVRPFTVEALVRAIRAVFADPPAAIERARRAQNASVTASWQQLESHYTDLIVPMAVAPRARRAPGA